MAGADVPDDDGVVGAGAEEDVLGRRVPFDVGDAPLVALEVHQPLAWPTQTEKTKKNKTPTISLGVGSVFVPD